jgi:hypothetical protein
MRFIGCILQRLRRINLSRPNLHLAGVHAIRETPRAIIADFRVRVGHVRALVGALTRDRLARN